MVLSPPSLLGKPAPFLAPRTYHRQLMFYLNGEKVVIDNPDPTLLLVDYLRSPDVGLTGTKKSCGQGGCGACTVMLSYYDTINKKVVHKSVNACLRPICSLDGMEITTVEGIGSVKTELNPVQYRIAKANGSQCGYCTPGFVMNMHSFLADQQGEPVTKREIEGIFDGNLCRCTGFRPILCAMKHFASDWTEEDERDCMECLVDPQDEVSCSTIPRADFPPELMHKPRPVYYTLGNYHWYRPTTLADVYQIMAACHTASNLKLVVGNTSIGVYNTYEENPQILVDISQISELRQSTIGPDGLFLGAAVTYSELLQTLETPITAMEPEQARGLVALRYLAGRTAGTIVRNTASLAGNTMLVVRHMATGAPFPSDLFTALCVLGAVVRVGAGNWKAPREYPILAFAEAYQNSEELQRYAVILSYTIPYTRAHEYVETYKVALREENAHAIVNGGLRVRLDAQGVVTEAAIVLGGIASIAIHATQVQAYLVGRSWTATTLAGALEILRVEVGAALARARVRFSTLPYEGFTEAYKLHLAESYLYKFFVNVAETIAPGTIPPEIASAGRHYERPLSRGTQSFKQYPQEYPVNQPIMKLGAFMQATGEAKYTHDISLPPRGLEAAFVTSTQALATMFYQIQKGDGYQRVDAGELAIYLKTRFPGVVDFITANDLPPGGQNLLGMGNDDPLFCTGQITCFGQSIGLVVANSERLAIDVAQFVQSTCIGYEPKRHPSGAKQEPIITIAEALAAKSIFADAPASAPWIVHVWKVTRPDSELAWVDQQGATHVDGIACLVVPGQQFVGSQIHFYMETQACVAQPGEHNELIVHPSSQSPDTIQQSIQRALGLRSNQISVRIKRVGGGYGGKTERSQFPAAAAALAAWKLGRPIRLAMPREIDTAMLGKRHAVYGEYRIAIADGSDNPDNKGKILGLQTAFWSDGGNTYDASFVVMDCIQMRCDSAYMIKNYQTEGDVCRTNKASNTAFRSMGLIQACLIHEDAIEAAAHAIAMLPEHVRGKNLYQLGDTTPYGQTLPECYMPQVWDYLINKCDFNKRAASVRSFNAANRWRKRGISMIPVQYGMGYNLTGLEQAGALVEIYDQDGTVLLRHGGVEIGQGLWTKVTQIAALTLNIPLTYINTGESDTNVIPNPTSTGASTGTEFNGEAVRQACEILKARLESFCQQLLDEKGPEWCKTNQINYWDYPEEGWRTIVSTPDGGETLIWCNIVKLSYWARVDLSADVRVRIKGGEGIDTGLTFKDPQHIETVNQFNGFTYSVACTEVEIDVLTGETTVLRADIAYDMGRSLNPALDIGQVEGAFVQGLGYVLSEELVFQPDGPNRGALNTLNTWAYKLPATCTIPLEFNVELFPREDAGVPENPNLLLSSKEVGEPPLVLAATAYFALKHAVLAARQDNGYNEWFVLEAPATVQRVREACLIDVADLTI